MHIMEGFLPPFWALFWYAVSLPFLVWGISRINRIFKERPEEKINLALAGAFIFVLSSLKLPSVAGSSSHPTGTGFSAIFYGPSITSVLSAIVLAFQALLLAHGGLTTLGANVFSMGIVGPAMGFFSFRLIRRAGGRLSVSVFTATFLTDFLTYVMTSAQLALAFPSANGFLESFLVFLGIFAITQIPLALAEGIVFVIFFDYLSKSRPKLLARVLGESA